MGETRKVDRSRGIHALPNFTRTESNVGRCPCARERVREEGLIVSLHGAKVYVVGRIFT